jgi:ribonuclease P protein component
VYRRGRPFRGDLVVLRILSSGQPLSRFGFTTGKAIGNAVTRNRVKRRLREAVRSLPVAPGWDVVLNARRGAEKAAYADLAGEVQRLLGRARLLEEPG